MESESERIIHKRLHFLLSEKSIEETIARRKPAQKWLDETIVEFNQVDRLMPKNLRLKIRRCRSRKLLYEGLEGRWLADLRGIAQTSAQPNALFYTKATQFLQTQQTLFENERALAIQEFVEKTRKNFGKIDKAEYSTVLQYIQGCRINAEIIRKILEKKRFLRTWVTERFAEFKR